MIVCRTVTQIEIDVQMDGSILICQEDKPDEPDLIKLYPEHVAALVKALRKAQQEAEEM